MEQKCEQIILDHDVTKQVSGQEEEKKLLAGKKLHWSHNCEAQSYHIQRCCIQVSPQLLWTSHRSKTTRSQQKTNRRRRKRSVCKSHLEEERVGYDCYKKIRQREKPFTFYI